MKFVFGALTLLGSCAQASSTTIAADRAQCFKAIGNSNPSVIRCDRRAVVQADKEMGPLIQSIKSQRLSGVDEHGVNRDPGQAFLDQSQASFMQSRQKTCDAAALAAGGTASDRGLASAEMAYEMTITRLKQLEDLL